MQSGHYGRGNNMAALVTQGVLRSGRHNVGPLLGTACVSKRNASTRSEKYALLKRGRGGRSSFSGVVATVFGATGFVGKIMVNRLGKIGSQVVIPYHSDPYDVQPLRMAGDLGQILFQPCHLWEEDNIKKSMKYSDVVINLIGKDYPTKNFDFEDVNVKGAALIARCAKEMGVEKLVHFSVLNASPDPPKFYTSLGSEFLRTKFMGEEAVREEFPEATIFRPADMYGQGDRFMWYYVDQWRRAASGIPLWRGGQETIKQPVFVSDVVQGVVNAIRDPDSSGQTYECVGPHRYQLSELVDYFYRCIRWEGMKIANPLFCPDFWLKMKILEYKPTTAVLTKDRFEREFVTDTLTGCPTLEDLGVPLTNLEDRANWELKPFRLSAYYQEQIGEFTDPQPPLRVDQLDAQA